MNLEYEPADETDIPILFELTKHLIDTYDDLDADDYETVLDWVSRKIKRYASEHQRIIADSQKCGYYYLRKDGELDLLYILPEFQNRGIGSEVLRKCIAESEKNMYLCVFTQNTGARSLYERFGFTIRETVGKTRLIMERKG